MTFQRCQRFCASPRHLAGALAALRTIPALSVPILTDEFRRRLLNEAELVQWRSAKNSIGSGPNVVLQRMLVQDRLDPDGAFADLANGFQSLFNEAISGNDLFADEVVFNDWMLQKYEVGKIGITPHRDRTDYRHIVCLFVLSGHGRFCVSDDRQRSNEQEIANLPGDVVLMPAPGYSGLSERPFHYLENIREQRYVFGLRHDRTKT